MFLSRLRTHPRDLLVIRDLGDATELHRTVMRGFPQYEGEAPRAAMHVLFRVETPVTGSSSGTTILVQSSVAPDWSALPEGYLLEQEVRPLDHVFEGVRVGRRYQFRLVANPSKKVAAPHPGEAPPRHSRRIGLLSDDDRAAWLDRKAEQAGFRVLGAGTEGAVVVSDVSPIGRPGSDRIHVRPAQFDGALEVVDLARFVEALRDGIGPARAYGCGLLSLAAMR